MKSLRLLILCMAFFCAACVSRTEPEQRMSDSSQMLAPMSASVVDPDHFTFAVVGDLHISFANTSRLKRILDAAEAEGDEFLLLLGDLVDQGDPADVEAIANTLTEANWRHRTYQVAGNHDVFHDGWTHYKRVFGSSTYVFHAGNSRFIALDTADGTLGAQQNAWLRGQLSASSSANTFLFSHYLPVVPGIQTYLKLANEDESLNLMALASQTKVKAWFGGHYHSHVQETIGGVQYVIAGGGGGRRMPPVQEFFFVQVAVSGNEVTCTRRPVL